MSVSRTIKKMIRYVSSLLSLRFFDITMFVCVFYLSVVIGPGSDDMYAQALTAICDTSVVLPRFR
jgi:hypothetical protein